MQGPLPNCIFPEALKIPQLSEIRPGPNRRAALRSHGVHLWRQDKSVRNHARDKIAGEPAC